MERRRIIAIVFILAIVFVSLEFVLRAFAQLNYYPPAQEVRFARGSAIYGTLFLAALLIYSSFRRR